jgi:hypothetical protein
MMPYTTPSLPFSGITSQSKHASYLGAKSAASRVHSQNARYLQLLREHPDGLTDAEAAKLMGIDRTSINARRALLVTQGSVYSDGFRKNPQSGIKNTIWKIAGR